MDPDHGDMEVFSMRLQSIVFVALKMDHTNNFMVAKQVKYHRLLISRV